MMKKASPTHPGVIIMEEFLKPKKITQYRLSKDIGVPPRRINEIVKGLRAISADTALRLGKFFGNSPEFWMNLQAKYDLAIQEDILAEAETEATKKMLDEAVSDSSAIEGLSFEDAKQDKEVIELLKQHGRAFAI